MRARVDASPLIRTVQADSGASEGKAASVASAVATSPPGESGIVRRIFAGLGLLLGGKAGAGLISLAYLSLATRFLGPADYGVLVLVHAYVTTVCGIIEFPAWQAIVRYGAEAQREGQTHRLSRLLWFATKLELSAGVLAVISAAALVPLVGPHLGWPPKAMAFAPYYAFAVLGSVRSVPMGYLRLVGRFDLLGLHNLVQPVIRLGGTIIVMACGWGIKSFLVAWLLSSLFEFGVLWAMGIWFAYRDLGPALLRTERGATAAENEGIWRFLVATNADLTFSDLAGRAAPLIVGWTLGPAMAGMLAVAQRATVIIAQPAQVLGNTVYSELAHIVAAGQGGGPLRRTLVKVIAISLLAALPVVALVLLVPHQISRLLAGSAFDAVAPVMAMLVVARALALIGPPCSSALTALGAPMRSMAANLFASLVVLPPLPFLLTTLGLMGAGYQALIQAVLGSGLLAVLVWRRSLRH